MARFFMALSYLGENYSGFQIQQNAITIQSEVETAMKIYFRKEIELTGSSRTDAGVHARNNYFHFDIDLDENHVIKSVYRLNAILPDGISILRIFKVNGSAHCRFDALSRTYYYHVHQKKNPFLHKRSFFYPYPLSLEKLNEAAQVILANKDFESFSKKHVQVKDFHCAISNSCWIERDGMFVYHVTGNRFLRGMVRGLVGTMLRVGTGKLSLDEFIEVMGSRDQTKVDFSVPGYGLFLEQVAYGDSIF